MDVSARATYLAEPVLGDSFLRSPAELEDVRLPGPMFPRRRKNLKNSSGWAEEESKEQEEESAQEDESEEFSPHWTVSLPQGF